MTVYTIPVKPKAPTILDGKVNTVELPGYELWMTYVSTDDRPYVCTAPRLVYSLSLMS